MTGYWWGVAAGAAALWTFQRARAKAYVWGVQKQHQQAAEREWNNR